jgi:tetratricopeptide (TPR) repeat protein
MKYKVTSITLLHFLVLRNIFKRKERMDDYLTQGIAAVKAGNKQEARRLLKAAIHAAPNDIRSWGWFYTVAVNTDERLRCVKEILRISPTNEKAKQKYDELIGLGYQKTVPVPNTARVVEVNIAKSSKPVNNKGGLSTIQGIIIGVLWGVAILAFAVIEIIFLFRK